MNGPSNKGAAYEPKKSGYFKMQVTGLLGPGMSEDSLVYPEDLPRVIEYVSERVPLKPEGERSPLPAESTAVWKLASWLERNQLVPSAPQTPP